MTPRASPSVVPSDYRPAKRPCLSKSTLRVLSVWDQLAERYNKRLDEDDIVDLYSGAIINDRGVLKSAGKDYNIGHFAPDDGQDDQEHDQADSEQDQDDDVDELDTLPARDPSETDHSMASTSELLRAVPPLSAATDADDLNEFLEAEKRRRELLGDQDDEDDMSIEELAAVRDALQQSQEDEEQAETAQEDEEQAETTQEDESEDELSVWQHEASAVYHVARNESEQDVAEGEQNITELTDSDEEFATLLERPPRVAKRKRISSSSSCGILSGHTLGNVATLAVYTICYQWYYLQHSILLRPV
jgi:glucan-binding YG repeat protein